MDTGGHTLGRAAELSCRRKSQLWCQLVSGGLSTNPPSSPRPRPAPRSSMPSSGNSAVSEEEMFRQILCF